MLPLRLGPARTFRPVFVTSNHPLFLSLPILQHARRSSTATDDASKIPIPPVPSPEELSRWRVDDMVSFFAKRLKVSPGTFASAFYSNHVNGKALLALNAHTIGTLGLPLGLGEEMLSFAKLVRDGPKKDVFIDLSGGTRELLIEKTFETQEELETYLNGYRAIALVSENRKSLSHLRQLEQDGTYTFEIPGIRGYWQNTSQNGAKPRYGQQTPDPPLPTLEFNRFIENQSYKIFGNLLVHNVDDIPLQCRRHVLATLDGWFSAKRGLKVLVKRTRRIAHLDEATKIIKQIHLERLCFKGLELHLRPFGDPCDVRSLLFVERITEAALKEVLEEGIFVVVYPEMKVHKPENPA